MSSHVVSDFTLAFFIICNALRIFAYVPQFFRVMRDREGAVAISYLTWSMFALANASTAIYTGYIVGEFAMTFIFVVNAIGCLAIVAATAFRRQLRGRTAPSQPPLCEILATHRIGD